MVVGGKSSEHEISLRSGYSIANRLNRNLYDVVFFSIDKCGQWGMHPHFPSFEEINCQKGNLFSSQVIASLMQCQIMFPVLHGTFGEDGTIQGFFEILDKPYIGCDYRSSAIAMDKALTKIICQSQAIATSPFVCFSKADWAADKKTLLRNIFKRLQFPLYIKPTHLGSAVGVVKVTDLDTLESKIHETFAFDDKILVEQEIKGREIEFAVIGNHRATVFHPGEVLTNGKFYSYDAKYGEEGFNTVAQANLAEDQLIEGKELALKVYKALGCEGMARVDFFLDLQGQFWLNEVNPIPGFTSISLYPKICEQNGLAFDKILDQLILLALSRHRKKRFSLA